jgi:hypothetical protein
MRRLALVAVFGLLWLAACGGSAATPAATPTKVPPTPEATPTRLIIVTPVVTDAVSADGRPGDPVPADIVATAEAIHGEGGVYVAGLLRPGDVPAGWQMDRAPQYAARSPEPGEMYSFACEQLPARSTGVATVGYRSLEGLPSLTVEYVIYATAEDAAAALAEMRAAAASCGTFTVTAAGGEVSARMTPLEFPAGGDASFAVALETASAATGDLLTHVIKIRQGRVIIGINHAARGGDPPPDPAVSERAAELTVRYLSQIE